MTTYPQQQRVPTVGIVVLQDSQVLLVEHLEGAGHVTGSFGTPAGRRDPGETDEDCAVRELKEESGLIAQKKDLVKLSITYEVDLKRKNGGVLPVSHTVFATRNFSGELQASEETRPQWIPIANISNLQLLPNIEDMVKRSQVLLPEK